MFDIRKIILVLLIGILFTVFVFSTINAVYPSPDYGDFCGERFAKPLNAPATDSCAAVDVPLEDQQACEGYIDYDYDSNNCATSYFCNTCQVQYDAARDTYNQIVFYITSLFALIAIFAGLYVPNKKNSLHEWIGTGFLLSGAFILLFGTVSNFGSLQDYVRPIVILVELVLVIFLAYKKIDDAIPAKKKK